MNRKMPGKFFKENKTRLKKEKVELWLEFNELLLKTRNVKGSRILQMHILRTVEDNECNFVIEKRSRHEGILYKKRIR